MSQDIEDTCRRTLWTGVLDASLGLVVATRIERELTQELTVLRDDAPAIAGDEEPDALALVGAADVDVA
jgi:hypothetical protein